MRSVGGETSHAAQDDTAGPLSAWGGDCGAGPGWMEGEANCGHQYVIVGGFLQECASSGLESAIAIVLGIAGGQDDDRD